MPGLLHKNRQLIAEVFEDLATEVTEEITFLEDFRDLNPDIRTLTNINPQSSSALSSQEEDLNQSSNKEE